jgi:hypothetical protein
MGVVYQVSRTTQGSPKKIFRNGIFSQKNIDISMGCDCGRKTRIKARLTSASARKERADEIVGGGLSPADRKRKIEILKRKRIL